MDRCALASVGYRIINTYANKAILSAKMMMMISAKKKVK